MPETVNDGLRFVSIVAVLAALAVVATVLMLYNGYSAYRAEQDAVDSSEDEMRQVVEEVRQGFRAGVAKDEFNYGKVEDTGVD